MQRLTTKPSHVKHIDPKSECIQWERYSFKYICCLLFYTKEKHAENITFPKHNKNMNTLLCPTTNKMFITAYKGEDELSFHCHKENFDV